VPCAYCTLAAFAPTDANFRGLALEAVVTVLTPRFTPFFMILWIIGMLIPWNPSNTDLVCEPVVNVSVSFYPIELLPPVFRYGKAAPFYNVSRAVRTIIFSTRNQGERLFFIVFFLP